MTRYWVILVLAVGVLFFIGHHIYEDMTYCNHFPPVGYYDPTCPLGSAANPRP